MYPDITLSVGGGKEGIIKKIQFFAIIGHIGSWIDDQYHVVLYS